MPNTTAVRTAQVGAAPFFAGKNAIINGDFRINQRAFTSNTTDQTYNFDRWLQFNSGGTVTVTPQTFTLGAAPVSGYEGTNFVQIAVSGQSGTNYAAFGQRIESVRIFAGQTVTVSFWAKATSGTPALSIELQQYFGSGGSSQVNTSASAATTLSTSWTRYSTTISLPSISGKTISGTDWLQLQFWLSAGSSLTSRTNSIGIQNSTFQIWGVQIEAGSVATSFQTATGTLAGELAACQRYYEKSYASATAIGTASVSQAFNGFYTVGSNQKMVNPGIWKVQKRTSPTVTVYDDAGNSGKISTLDTGGTATNNVAIAIIDTDDTSFRALGSSNGTQAGYKWNWVASAEL